MADNECILRGFYATILKKYHDYVLINNQRGILGYRLFQDLVTDNTYYQVCLTPEPMGEGGGGRPPLVFSPLLKKIGSTSQSTLKYRP